MTGPIFMSTAAHAISPFESDNRRYASRRTLRLPAALSDRGIEVLIHDLSPTGMLVESEQDLVSGDSLLVDLPERGSTAATVIWSSGHFHGCEFVQSIPSAAISAALLRSPIEPAADAPPARLDIDRLQELAASIEADDLIDDRYSLRTRGLVLGGLLITSWGAIGWALSALL